ncbi:MAG: c-type cytochrome [Magnetovibrio sp.]|nr:c-type cytochrome [Magnetovibrio sp.]
MNKTVLKYVTLLTGILMAVSMVSAPASAAEKKKRDPGKKVYLTKACMACHGKNGRKAMLEYPNLAGQDEKYLVTQITSIIAGKRLGSPDATGNPRSQGMQGALISASDNKPRISKAEIKQVAKWLAKQKPADLKEPKTPLDPASVAAGKKLFKKKCRACHGKEGMKPLKGTPFLAGQKRNYLMTQLQDIKSKARSTPKTKAMYATVKKLADDDFANLADYLSQLERKVKK